MKKIVSVLSFITMLNSMYGQELSNYYIGSLSTKVVSERGTLFGYNGDVSVEVLKDGTVYSIAFSKSILENSISLTSILPQIEKKYRIKFEMTKTDSYLAKSNGIEYFLIGAKGDFVMLMIVDGNKRSLYNSQK